MITKLIQELEKELKDTRFKHKFALETMERLEKDIEFMENTMRDIEADIRRHSREVDRTSYAAIKWTRDN